MAEDHGYSWYGIMQVILGLSAIARIAESQPVEVLHHGMVGSWPPRPCKSLEAGSWQREIRTSSCIMVLWDVMRHDLKPLWLPITDC